MVRPRQELSGIGKVSAHPAKRGGVPYARNAKLRYGFLWTGFLSFDRSEDASLIITGGQFMHATATVTSCWRVI